MTKPILDSTMAAKVKLFSILDKWNCEINKWNSQIKRTIGNCPLYLNKKLPCFSISLIKA